jgi:DNA-directed RNA polymerase specialized sigma24 family protein
MHSQRSKLTRHRFLQSTQWQILHDDNSVRLPAGRHSLDDAALQTDPRILSREPPVSELVETEETFDQLLAGRPELHQLVLGLKRINCTVSEIASALEVNERTVRRILDQLPPPAPPVP